MSDYTHVRVFRAQRRALARKFAPGLLRPFSGMNVSVRLGEIAQTILSRWPIPSQPAKPACELLLSHSKRSRALADVAGKFVFVISLMEFIARAYRCLGRQLEGG